MSTETPQVSYVVQAKRGDGPWIVMTPNAGDTEEEARRTYAEWVAQGAANGRRHRLAKRTAVVTIEVLLAEPELPQVPDIPVTVV